jgi:PRC-barrel domain
MSAPISDVSSLPGKKIADQEETPIGVVKEVYAVDGDGAAAWVAVEASFGIADKRLVFVPLARIKEENGGLRVPYSKRHIERTPEVDGADGIPPEAERLLRDHYGIDRADQELRTDNVSYATLVPEEDGVARRAEDPAALDTPDADRRTDETHARLQDPGRSEARHVTADGVGEQSDDG